MSPVFNERLAKGTISRDETAFCRDGRVDERRLHGWQKEWPPEQLGGFPLGGRPMSEGIMINVYGWAIP